MPMASKIWAPCSGQQRDCRILERILAAKPASRAWRTLGLAAAASRRGAACPRLHPADWVLDWSEASRRVVSQVSQGRRRLAPEADQAGPGGWVLQHCRCRPTRRGPADAAPGARGAGEPAQPQVHRGNVGWWWLSDRVQDGPWAQRSALERSGAPRIWTPRPLTRLPVGAELFAPPDSSPPGPVRRRRRVDKADGWRGPDTRAAQSRSFSSGLSGLQHRGGGGFGPEG